MLFILKLAYLSFFILFATTVSAQVMEDIQYFTNNALEKNYINPEQGLEFVQKLIANDKSNNKIIYQNIAAQSYSLMGDYQKSVQSVLDQEKLSNRKNSFFQEVFTDYLLANQYQNLGFYEQSKKTISQIISKKNRFKSSEFKDLLAKVYSLSAINNLISKNYEKADTDINLSNALLSKTSEGNEILKLENQIFFGIINLQQKKIVAAEKIFNTVYSDTKIKKYPFLYAFLIKNMGQLKFLQQKPSEAIILLNSALQIIKNTKYEPLRTSIYENLSNAYLALSNHSKFQEYRKLFQDNNKKLDSSKKLATSYLVNIVENSIKNDIAIYKSQKRKFTFFISILALVTLFGFYVFYYLKNRREREHKRHAELYESFQQRIAEINNKKEEIEVFKTSLEKDLKKSSWLSPEKEKELLLKLRQFELSELYLSSQMSLSFLATELGTNTKYLSEVIRKSKNKNFNTYINELRIQYIVNVLKTNSSYLNYKVSYLAEITGFSSHSAFTAVFKSITGMSPNDFIQQINNQNNK